MNQIDQLVTRFSPNGVELVALKDVIAYEQPTRYIVKSTEYDDAFPIPVLTAGQTFVLGKTNEENGIYSASKDNPVVIFDDFTTAKKWVDFKFKVKSSAMKILTSRDSERADLRYVYFAMQTIRYHPRDHARQWIGIYSNFQIPLPPLEVQREIVRILDKFTQLEAELEAELEARQKQYAHYRKELLTFRHGTAEEMTLGDLGPVAMCKRVFKAETTADGEIPFYKIGTFGKQADAYIPADLYREYKDRYPFPKIGDVLLSAAGTIGRAIPYDGEPAYFQDSNIVWIDNDESVVTNDYLYHWYQVIDWTTDGGTIKRLYNSNLRRAAVMVPPIEEQNRIVSVLDKFDALVNDLSSGLPAEIAARRRQYEYYRDRLLTFKELAS